MAWSLATQFNVDNTIADQWFLYSHVFTKRWLIIHIESNEIPETWESVGYAIPAYLLNNDSLPGIDDSWIIGGDDRDNRYRLLPLKAQELVAPFEQGQAYRLYFRFVRYMRNATISIYENDQEPSYGNGGTGVVSWADIQGDKLYSDLVGLPDLSSYISPAFAVVFDDTGSGVNVLSSKNITSITRNALSRYVLNFTTELDSDNYLIAGFTGNIFSSTQQSWISAPSSRTKAQWKTTTALEFWTVYANHISSSQPQHITIFGFFVS
jgi:hypothetical protein